MSKKLKMESSGRGFNLHFDQNVTYPDWDLHKELATTLLQRQLFGAHQKMVQEENKKVGRWIGGEHPA